MATKLNFFANCLLAEWFSCCWSCYGFIFLFSWTACSLFYSHLFLFPTMTFTWLPWWACLLSAPFVETLPRRRCIMGAVVPFSIYSSFLFLVFFLCSHKLVLELRKVSEVTFYRRTFGLSLQMIQELFDSAIFLCTCVERVFSFSGRAFGARASLGGSDGLLLYNKKTALRVTTKQKQNQPFQ